MSPNQWGPPTWVFIHTLAEKIREESFPILGQALIIQIIQICSNLPCPECSTHAKKFWSQVKINNVKTKTDLINVLFVFHNLVNQRKGYPQFKKESLAYYKSKNIVETFNSFARNFHTNGNMKLITESFHRNRFLALFRTWFMNNIQHFIIN